MEKIEGIIKVPKGYFLKTAKADYQNYRRALPREFYQNSIDAGATKIEVSFEDLKDGNWKITVKDDGHGMDKNVLLNHLLVLGGSYKTGEAVGTFGVAKEILFLSWTKYQIHTQNWIVNGSGDEYTVQRTEDYFDGTLCEIFMPEEEFKEVKGSFREVAAFMETNCQIQVGKEIVFSEKKRGELLRQCGWFDVYFTPNKSACNWNISVRVAGIWMFDKYVGTMPGSMIVEISKSSMETLTSNRDGLISRYEIEFSGFIGECISERESILKPKPKFKRELYKGTGKISMHEFADSFREETVQFSSTEEVLAYIKAAASKATGTSPDIIEERLSQLRKKVEQSQYFDTIKAGAFIGYEPDFIVKRGERDDVARALETKLFQKLIRVWTEIVKQVMIDNELFEVNFRCGFDFDKDTSASFESGSEGWIFYINPRRVMQGSNRYQDLRLKAVHELAHIDCNYHNETFVLNLHSLLIKTWKSERVYKKIVTQV